MGNIHILEVIFIWGIMEKNISKFLKFILLAFVLSILLIQIWRLAIILKGVFYLMPSQTNYRLGGDTTLTIMKKTDFVFTNDSPYYIMIKYKDNIDTLLIDECVYAGFETNGNRVSIFIDTINKEETIFLDSLYFKNSYSNIELHVIEGNQ